MLHYHVEVADPHGHYFDVQLQTQIDEAALFDAPEHPCVRLTLPAWIPGSYLIREFARHVLWLNASVNGQEAIVNKLNKDTWEVHMPKHSPTGLLQAKWRVYAWDLSVRGAHLDESHGFFNGTSLFVVPLGLESKAVNLRISRPADAPGAKAWHVACGLSEADSNPRGVGDCPVLTKGGFVQFQAENYDALIDHPVEMGELQVGEFDACGTKHLLAVYGADEDLDINRVCADLAPVCAAQIRLFEPVSQQAPFDRYVFMLHATDNGYGGLEHRNSTALLCSRADLPQRDVKDAPSGYETFLGLCSHEYFHAWNVKRMKPQAFLPYRLHEENYTRLLWVFEGFTSYYDDLILKRAGKMDEAAYLKALGKTVSQVLKGPGRLNQPVATSSLEAWTKYYRQDENAPNAIVSYYTKGALVALCLDATIQSRTEGEHSLDDVMRLMWREKGSEERGLGETEFPELVQRATGLDLRQEISNWTETTAELPLAECLGTLGYSLQPKHQEGQQVWFGWTGQFNAEGLKVKQVINGSPAHLAGVSAGDTIVALGEHKMTEARQKRVSQATRPGEPVALMGFRAEKLMRWQLVAQQPAVQEWTVTTLHTKTNEATTQKAI